MSRSAKQKEKPSTKLSADQIAVLRNQFESYYSTGDAPTDRFNFHRGENIHATESYSAVRIQKLWEGWLGHAEMIEGWYSRIPVKERFTIDIVSGQLVQDRDGSWVLNGAVDKALHATNLSRGASSPTLTRSRGGMRLMAGLDISTEEFWYDLSQGGYIKPAEMLEYPDDVARVEAAIAVLKEFESACTEQVPGFIR